MKARRSSIEPARLPLLRRMHERAGGAGRALPRMPVEKHLAPMRSQHLNLAGIKRVDLKSVVGEAGFEPATTSTQSSCTTGLCDSPERARALGAGT